MNAITTSSQNFYQYYKKDIDEVRNIIAQKEKVEEIWILYATISFVCCFIVYWFCILPFCSDTMMQITSVISSLPGFVAAFYFKSQQKKKAEVYIEMLHLCYNTDVQMQHMFEAFAYVKANIPQCVHSYPLFYVNIAHSLLTKTQ